MSSKHLIGVILMIFLLGGCSIYSLHPLYNASTLIFDTKLIGIWVDNDGNEWNFEKAIKFDDNEIQKLGLNENSYFLTYTENNKQAQLYAHIVKLENNLFLDLYPADNYDEQIGNDLLAGHLLPIHTFAKIEINRNDIIIHPFDVEWVDNLFEQKKIRIAHEDVEYFGLSLRVLTASTAELQKFISKYQNEKEAFEKVPDILKRNI
jgi:hypothetical protein